MSTKYGALLEACNTIQLTGKLGILEESSVDEATSIKLQLVLQENVNFIKNQITRTPLIENVQMMLAEKWTQAILEDIDLAGMVPYGQEDEGFDLGTAGAIAGTGALAAGARYAIPGAAKVYNKTQELRNRGFDLGPSFNQGIIAGKQNIAGNIATDKAALQNGYNSAVNAVNNGYNNAANAMSNAVETAKNYPAGFKSGYNMAMKDPLLGQMAADIGNSGVKAGAKIGNVVANTANTVGGKINGLGKAISKIGTKVTRRA